MEKNKIKVILFDADGVVVKSKGKKFSERLSKVCGIPLETINLFFKNEFKSCVVGKADLREELPRYLALWGWKGALDELLTLWFSWEEELNESILTLIQALRTQGIRCYLISEQERYRARYFGETMGVKKHFDGCFFSCDIGHKKSERIFYEEVFKRIGGAMPKETLFFDDDEKNVEAARELGVHAYFYKNFEDFKQTIHQRYGI